jgi:hypothetical protein
MRGLRFTVAIIATLALTPPLFAQIQPIAVGPLQTNFARITTIPVTQSGLPFNGEPLDLVTVPGDAGHRLFVATHRGQVRLIKNNVLQPTSFLDLSARGVTIIGGIANDERGLLGLTFHPNFYASASTPGSGKFYTYTSESKTGQTPDFYHPENGLIGGDHHSVIREWTVNPANPDVADPNTASRILMRITQPQQNHNGGAMRFGNDGLLYIALGDGGGSNDQSNGTLSNSDGHSNPNGNGQDITNVYGKVLRINPTGNNSANGRYGVGAPVISGALPEIFAYGLRNPFRMNFDRVTGRLYLGDVGQGQREEVDIIAQGANFGWAHYEGTRANPAPDRPVPPGFTYTVPIGEYTSADGHSVIGGFVYRGSNPDWAGQYIFGDYNGNAGAGRLFYMDPNGGTIRQFQHPAGSGLLYGWGEDLDGELYALFNSGAVEKLVARNAWNVDGGGSWGLATNWDGGIPLSNTDARFLNRLSRGNSATITLDGDRLANRLIISNPNPYTIAQGTGGTLRIGTPGVQILRGSHTITAPFGWNTTSSVDVAQGAQLTLSGPINFFGGPVLKSGPGKLVLNNQVQNFGGQIIQQDGQVDLNTNTGVPATSTTAAGPRLTLTAQRNNAGTSNTLIVLNADQDMRQLRSNFTDPQRQGIDLNSPTTPGAFRSVRVYPLSADPRAEIPFLTNAIINARANPGDGIFDSGLASRPGSAIGVALATDAFGQSHILMRPTKIGDLNLDGTVSIADFITLAANFNTTNATWDRGDINYDRTVTIADFIDLAGNFNSNYSGGIFPISPADQQMLADFYAANVPEPSAAGVILICAAHFFRRRRLSLKSEV